MDSKSKYTSEQLKSQLIKDNPQISEQEILDSLLILHASENFVYPDSHLESNLIQFKTAIGKSSPMKVYKNTQPKFHMFKWLSAAVVLLMISFGVWQYLKPEASFIQNYATLENVLDITLEDGSSVKLNSYSNLEVLSMNGQQRLLRLEEGEAYFDVIHNQSPFVVVTGKGNVLVKGTQFNIKNRKNLPLNVSLKEGLVHFENDNEFVELYPGESLIVDNQSIKKLSVENDFSWLNGELKFSNQTLSDIIKELSALYHVNFKYEQGLADLKLTITFQNLTVQQAAVLLSKTINSKVEVE
jgi:transmembrane sensor